MFDGDVHDMYDFTGPVLGSGAFATVLRVKDRVSGVEYAMKQVLRLLLPRQYYFCVHVVVD